jgi:hypothetical protein
MKIVRLVLLLAFVGLSAACNGAAITEPENTATAAAPRFDGTNTPPDTSGLHYSGGVFGSGT